MEQLGSFMLDGRCIDIWQRMDAEGQLQIRLSCQKEPYAAISAQVPGYLLTGSTFFAKTYSENACLREPLLLTGLFIDTGWRATSGYAVLEIWTLAASSRDDDHDSSVTNDRHRKRGTVGQAPIFPATPAPIKA